ncbi:MAG TPA: Crp/Fnr family transcriptional regulator [Firmicutes bacterium]|nr:Crp/Fnr family transcriptional regulator [Bacillota bacterium]
MFEHELFKYFDCRDLSLLHKRSQDVSLSKGDILFLQGHVGSYVYYVKSGTLKIVKTSEDGIDKIFSIYHAGQFVALNVLFNPPHYYIASGIAVEPCEVIAIPIDTLQAAILASEQATMTWFAHLNQRLENLQQLLTDQVFVGALERFRKLVKMFAKTHGRLVGEEVVIELPITKQEMAELLSVRRETFSRLLASLKDEGVCTFSHKQITVNANWIK